MTLCLNTPPISSTPRNLIFDKSGNLYIGAYGIYEITPADVQTELFRDNVFGGWEIVRDDQGNLYTTTFNYTTNGGNEIRKVTIR